MNFSLQNEFYSEIRTLIESSRTNIYESVNFAEVQTYWQIGKRIFEEEQKGKGQIDFEEVLIESLESQLTGDFGNSFDGSNLIYMRRFFSTFPVLNTLRPLLSWSHYRLIINVVEEQAQIFYMNKAADNHWSVQQLSQQIESRYYQWTLSVKTKKLENQELREEDLLYESSDLIRDPYLLGFLNIKPFKSNKKFELEWAVLDRIQNFMLELANGFCLVSRQKHQPTEQNEHYHIDLVFYNYLLRCFVLINFRFGPLTDEDVLVMDRYTHMYDDKFRPKDDNPTFGIIICSNNGETDVTYASLNEKDQLFSTLYQLVIPSREELAKIVNDEILNQLNEN
ncbi:MAG TPA: PDDEXK nuclease domain-containing protein [Prolixibacteraceae bacterium]|nr:PDDEXK nuclease domain-containing protein [Prolixibacteraceae bacterium]